MYFRPGWPWSNDALPPPPPPLPWELAAAIEEDLAVGAVPAVPAEVGAITVGGTLSYSSEVLRAFSQRRGGGCRTKTWCRPLQRIDRALDSLRDSEVWRLQYLQ